MPTNAAKKALAKAKRGIVATGACSTKADPNFAALKDNKSHGREGDGAARGEHDERHR